MNAFLSSAICGIQPISLSSISSQQSFWLTNTSYESRYNAIFSILKFLLSYIFLSILCSKSFNLCKRFWAFLYGWTVDLPSVVHYLPPTLPAINPISLEREWAEEAVSMWLRQLFPSCDRKSI